MPDNTSSTVHTATPQPLQHDKITRETTQTSEKPTHCRTRSSRWFSFSDRDIQRSAERRNSHDLTWLQQAGVVL